MLANPGFLDNYKDQHIIVAPLNWGLGHATRCLPLIDALAETNQLTIASDGISLEWLKCQRPQLKVLELPSYPILYQEGPMWLNMLRCGPGILQAIKKEKEIINQWIRSNRTDLIISDHRLGIRNRNVKSVFLAHQLIIPHRYKFIEAAVSRWQTMLINKFDVCWIPDHIGPSSLSGRLSSPSLSIPKRYIGTLSRLQLMPGAAMEYDLAIVLSGPEPARSSFEDLLARELHGHSLKIAFIRGSLITPSNEFLHYSSDMMVINLANDLELNNILCSSSIILSRSGYSTIMDLSRLRKKAILIPTPGQPEQEYLAELHQNRWYILDQSDVNRASLQDALRVLSK